jgi:glutaredoxin
MALRVAALRVVALMWVIALPGCEPEKPPAPPPTAAAGSAPASDRAEPDERIWFVPGEHEAVLTFAGERGAFSDAAKVDDVPVEARGLVRISLLEGPSPPPGQVWVANLRTPDPDGRHALETVPRDLFEELALGQGRSSPVDLPEGLEPPEAVAANTGEVIVYKTQWCGVCKKLESYLDRKGVRYVAKDIEHDPAAAAELQAKGRDKGIKTGSVPVIDVRGELLVGFDRARLEKLL